MAFTPQQKRDYRAHQAQSVTIFEFAEWTHEKRMKYLANKRKKNEQTTQNVTG